MLAGRKVLLGVTGSIAADQAVDLVGLLRAELAFVEPEYGPMACGSEGWGRLARRDRIVSEASRALEPAPRPVTGPLEPEYWRDDGVAAGEGRSHGRRVDAARPERR